MSKQEPLDIDADPQNASWLHQPNKDTRDSERQPKQPEQPTESDEHTDAE